MINGEKEIKFPLDRNQIKAIFSSCIYGFVQLSGGTATITDPRISTDSLPLITRKSTGGTIGDLRCDVGNGIATITSTSSSDTSTVFYFIIPYLITAR
jgi:hypothetical protein